MEDSEQKPFRDRPRGNQKQRLTSETAGQRRRTGTKITRTITWRNARLRPEGAGPEARSTGVPVLIERLPCARAVPGPSLGTVIYVG